MSFELTWPLWVLAMGVVFVVITIAVLRVHPFIALILAALLVGILAPVLPELPGRPEAGHLIRAVEWTMTEFGRTVAAIGFVIALAAIIGVCLLESGAADKIVRRLMAVFGEKHAPIALLAGGFFLSIPVFFDTVFLLLIPLARALCLRTGRNFVLYVMALCGGAVVTHSVVPPTPGPLLVVDMLQLDLGLAMVVGIAAGILPAAGVYFLARFLDARLNLPLRDGFGAALEHRDEMAEKPESELPPLWASIMPVILPVMLVALASFFVMAGRNLPGVVAALGGEETFRAIHQWVEFLGNRNIALFAGAAAAMLLLVWSKRDGKELGKVMAAPLETAGVIILITGAGGAFGAMIRHSGVGAAIEAIADGLGVNHIVLAWTVTAVIRAAQGSATVAMISGAGLMAAVVGDGSQLPYHPIYIFLAIAYGSMILSWMNDSGFWLVGRLSGFTPRETLKTWTVLVTFLSVAGLVQILIFSALVPLKSVL